MKLKHLFALLLSAVILFACGDKGPDVKPATDDLESRILGETGQFLMKNGSQVDTLIIRINTKDEKLWIRLYENATPMDLSTPIFEWTDTEKIPMQTTIDLGYGDIKQSAFKKVNIVSGCGFDNGAKYISYTVHYSDILLGRVIKLSGNNKQVLESSESYGHSLRLWYGDNFILNSSYCYDKNGNKIFTFAISPYSYGYENCVPISLESGMCFISTYHIKCVNFKTDTDVWESIISFSGLLENARLDNYGLTKKDGNNWHYNYNYTLYSGEKATYKFSVNIETGEITYI